jgi:hypothetical protein
VNTIGKAAGFLFAFSLASFAPPSFADGKHGPPPPPPPSLYTLNVGVPSGPAPGVATTPISPGSNIQLRAVFTNVSGNASFNSLTLQAPAGITITKVTAVSSGYPSPRLNQTTSVSYVNLTKMYPVGLHGIAWIDFQATVSAGACGNLRWNPHDPPTTYVFTGSGCYGSGFDLTIPTDGSAPASTSVSSGFVLGLSIQQGQSSSQSGVLVNTPYSVTAQLSAACGAVPASVPINLSGTNGVVVAPTTQGTNSNGTSVFTATSPNLGLATLTASAPSLNLTQTLPVTAFASAGLACDPSVASYPPESEPLAQSIFTASAPNALTPDSPGYAEGVRGVNKGDPTPNDCSLVNWTWTNNVLSTAPVTDQNGNSVPPNAASFVWDQTWQPSATYIYTVTWQPEWVDPDTGLPAETTQQCTNTGCTAKAPVVACAGTGLVAASMPPNQKACIVSETRNTVPLASCTAPQPAGTYAACIQVSTTFIDFADPVLIRD